MALLERETLLATLDRRLAAGSGAGRLVLIAGEAGVGKTAVVDAWIASQGDRIAVRSGSCDGSATPMPLAPIRQAFPELAAAAVEGDRLRLLASVTDLVRSAHRPAVLRIEDAHWADEATVDVLRALSVRLAEMPALVLVTYRAEDVAGSDPLAVLIGDLAGRPAVTTVVVPPLSPSGVSELARAAGLDVDPVQLHRTTGGNSFHVTEVLAAGGVELPTTVRDAVRARVARLSRDGREAVHVVALAGLCAEPELLEDILGEAVTGIDEAVERGVLVSSSTGVQFRHDLARRAVAADVPPMRRIALHRAILRALQRHPEHADAAQLAHQAEGARDPVTALPAAVEAARRSSRAGAHREAVLHYERALRVAPPDHDGRVRLVEDLSFELYLTGRIDDSITQRAEALRIHTERGERLGAADCHRWLSRLNWFAARGAAAEAHGQRAVELADTDTPTATGAMALSNMAQLRMLSGDLPAVRHWGGRAVAMGRAVGADDVVSHALNSVGAAEAVVGDYDAGLPMLLESLELARQGDFHEHVGRAYTNLIGVSVTARRFDDIAGWAAAGTRFCADHDMETWRLCLEGYVALQQLYRCRLAGARELTDRILQDGRVPEVNRLTPLMVRGVAQARVGDRAAAGTLAEVLAIAESSGEFQRLAAAAAGLAELAWLRNEPPPAALRTAFELGLERGSAWEIGELARWLFRAGQLDTVPARIAVPYAKELAGRVTQAAAAWAALDCPYDEAVALTASTDLDDVARATRLFADLGATAAAARAGRRVAELGGVAPRPRRSSTRSHPAGLTTREAQVLPLLVDGASNADIAAALVISERTAEHHVSAVLGKLGVTRRHDVQAAVRRLGWSDMGTASTQPG